MTAAEGLRLRCPAEVIFLQVLLLAVGLVACCSDCWATEWTIEAEPWPEADVLFKRDSRWVGADAANTVDLGDGRVLWTFGDSFISTHPDPAQRRRVGSEFIRNSIAIQQGYDPTTAEFQPHWQKDLDGKPNSFFRAEGDVFFWPGGGVRLGRKVLVFLMRVRNAQRRLGFEVVGWGAVLIDNPGEPPPNWRMLFITPPQNSFRVVVGSGSAIRDGEFIYAFGYSATLARKQFVVRFPVESALAGDLSRPEWWTGEETGWIAQQELADRLPLASLQRGQTEFTVHFQPELGQFLLTEFQGFPRTPITIRRSGQLTGPWSPAKAVFQPDEIANAKPDVMLYAAKVHPEQLADGLAVTYCSNSSEPSLVMVDEKLYYPRFARIVLVDQAEPDAN